MITNLRIGINAIEIENFKAIGERVRIEIKPLTLIFGPNSAGKSTIIQALHAAREIFGRHNLDPDQTVSGGTAFDLGGFRNVVHNHQVELPLKLWLAAEIERLPNYELDIWGMQFLESKDWSLDREEMFRRCHSVWAEVEIHWSAQARAALAVHYQVGLNGQLIARTRGDTALGRSEIEYLDLAHPILEGGIREPDSEFPQEFRPLRELFAETTIARSKELAIRFEGQRDRAGRRSALPPWDDVIATDPTVFAKKAEWEEHAAMLLALTRMIVGPGEAIRNELSRLRYLGPVREMPARNYAPPRWPDNQRWATGLGAWDRLHESDQEFIERVNRWLSRLKCGYTVRLKEYKEIDWSVIPPRDAPPAEWKTWRDKLEQERFRRRVVLVPDGESIEVLPNDVGIGISQLLPAVVLALDAEAGIIAIEQPEIHLHPALQADLADVFIDSALGERRNTFLLETHSEHLILRILRRIRETSAGELPDGVASITPDQVAVLYVQPGKNGAEVVHIPVNADGEFERPWPKGFFAERARELF